ncbi:MAG: hypothetical protein ACKVOX_14395, partial [Rhizobacter sp.]
MGSGAAACGAKVVEDTAAAGEEAGPAAGTAIEVAGRDAAGTLADTTGGVDRKRNMPNASSNKAITATINTTARGFNAIPSPFAAV